MGWLAKALLFRFVAIPDNGKTLFKIANSLLNWTLLLISGHGIFASHGFSITKSKAVQRAYFSG